MYNRIISRKLYKVPVTHITMSTLLGRQTLENPHVRKRNTSDWGVYLQPFTSQNIRRGLIWLTLNSSPYIKFTVFSFYNIYSNKYN